MIPKFRAWDKNDKVMIYNVTPLLDTEGDLECIIFDYTLCGYDFLEIELEEYTSIWGHEGGELPYILMQSTGLKDKNGVEIFEGDVVVGQQHLTTDLSTPSEIKGLVRYSKRNTMFYLDEKSFGHDKFMNSLGSSIYQFEVTGNIYENPELLEVEG